MDQWILLKKETDEIQEQKNNRIKSEREIKDWKRRQRNGGEMKRKNKKEREWEW